MSNNWGRTKYDECRIKESIDDSVSPLSYRLYPGQNRTCTRCVSLNGPRSNSENTRGQPSDVVSIESKLRNIDGKYNSRSCRNDTRNFENHKKNMQDNLIGACGDQLDYTSTRLDHPQVREIKTWEFTKDFPPLPPQDNIYYFEEMNTRLQTKDLYDSEAAICKEFKKVQNQYGILPKPKDGSNDKCI